MKLPNTRILFVVGLALASLALISIVMARRHIRTDAFSDMEQAKNVFTLYYMNGCPHCESILPAYKNFVAQGQIELDGKKIMPRMVEQGDSSASAEIDALKITGFPTFYLKTKSGKQVEYKGDRTIPAITEFLKANAV